MHALATEVEVQTVPFGSETREDRWDLFSGPDLYYEVYDPDGTRLFASEVVTDVRPRDLPLTLAAGFHVADPGRHVLQLLDADLGEDEVMGRMEFALGQIVDESPGSTPPSTVELSDGDLVLWLRLEWTGQRA